MNRKDREELLLFLEEKEQRVKYNKIKRYYPEKGPLRRELYPKHMKFFEDGSKYRERLFMAANRVGKTEGAGAVEVTYHLTGDYPFWWKGKRFDRHITCWVAGNSAKTTRDIIQNKLYGPRENKGSGLIPKDYLISESQKSGVPDAYDTCKIRHKSGGVSTLVFKSFDQGRTAFEGEKVDVIWLDEEPPLNIYTESLLRTADTSGLNLESGIILLTFTPLMGMSETVLSFLPGGEINEKIIGSKSVTMASWQDVPHLTEETKQELLAAIPPYQRDARTKGIPQLGSGAIYPVAESDIVVSDFEIPEHWPKAYGLDVGWNRTAAAFITHDRESDIIYIYSEHYRGQAEPSIHAEGIKSRGNWIKGVIDPASRGRSQHDGQKLIEQYNDLGLDLEMAKNSVESGIYEVWMRLSTGRLKVFKSCQNWVQEYRLYRRDEKGQIVKQNDHLMDCLHPETKITTDKGIFKIIDLVGTTGNVLSVGGHFFKYEICAKTKTNAEILKLTFSDGQQIKCTPEHKILTVKGWVMAKDMLNKKVNISKGKNNLWSQKSSMKSVKNMVEKSIIFVESIFREMVLDCTEKFTKNILVKFLKDFIFTIKTMILLIINYQIFLLSKLKNIFQYIIKEFLNHYQKKHYGKQHYGTNQIKATSGIRCIMKKIKKNYISIKNLIVSFVVKNILHKSLEKINFVLTIANQKTEEILELIMKKELVLFVKKISMQISIQKRNVVQESVVCVSVLKDENSDTYCLKVPYVRAFAVEKGLIVHNCTRYAIVSGIERLSTKPVKKQNIQEFGYGSTGGWMG